jgi:hypothetical protein
MTFWANSNLDPKRKFRFRFSTPSSAQIEGFWWFAKSIDKPTYTVNSGEYQLINHKFKYPGIAVWNDISMTVVDPGHDTSFGISPTKALIDELEARGHKTKPGGDGIFKYNPSTGDGVIDEIVIEQLDAKGTAVETWTLNGAWIKTVNFGSLSYQDDEIVEIELEVSYDYATFIGN